jgi:hypothetical protein
MKINEITDCEAMCKLDIDLTDTERRRLLDYSDIHMTEDYKLQFAITDILTKYIEDVELRKDADIIEAVCENAAELGCPVSEDVDMWFRKLSKKQQMRIVASARKIIETYQ